MRRPLRLWLLRAWIRNRPKRRLHHRLLLLLHLLLLQLLLLQLLLLQLLLLLLLQLLSLRCLRRRKILDEWLVERLHGRRRVTGGRWQFSSCGRLRSGCYDDALPLNHNVVERLTLEYLSNAVGKAETGKLDADVAIRQLGGDFRLHTRGEVD